MLPSQLAGQYLDAAIQVIEAEAAGIPVKISAVKAVHKLVSVHLYDRTLTKRTTDISFCQGADDGALVSFVPRIAKDLAPFLLVTTEDTLSLVLETLAVVVKVDDSKWMTSDLAHSLVVTVLDVWAKNNKGDENSLLPD